MLPKKCRQLPRARTSLRPVLEPVYNKSSIPLGLRHLSVPSRNHYPPDLAELALSVYHRVAFHVLYAEPRLPSHVVAAFEPGAFGRRWGVKNSPDSFNLSSLSSMFFSFSCSLSAATLSRSKPRLASLKLASREPNLSISSAFAPASGPLASCSHRQ